MEKKSERARDNCCGGVGNSMRKGKLRKCRIIISQRFGKLTTDFKTAQNNLKGGELMRLSQDGKTVEKLRRKYRRRNIIGVFEKYIDE